MPSFSITQTHAQPSPSPTSLTTASRIIVIGAGTFGLSTAFHLLGRGYTDVTVLDRARGLPAVDAAGTDINKGASRHRPAGRWPASTNDILKQWSGRATATCFTPS